MPGPPAEQTAQSRRSSYLASARARRCRLAAGLCHDCAAPAEDSRTMCKKHLARARKRENRQVRRDYKRGKGRFLRSRYQAKRFGKPWSLLRDEYEALVASPCDYCEINHTSCGIGLDRLDNAKGYVRGNVVSCCYECNVARNDHFTPCEMRVIGQAIRQVKLARLHERGE